MAHYEDHEDLLKSQIEYYRARALEYDEWFLRRGRYNRGSDLNQVWFDEIEAVRGALETYRPEGHILELACGTGLWTAQLLRYATQITAVDASAEMLAINRARTQSSNVIYIQSDLFEWTSAALYDVVFFGFWLSHVPPERFDMFWRLVGRALKPDGRMFFVDSRYNQFSTAKDHRLEGPAATAVDRLLNDGRVFRIVKVFYDPISLSAKLEALNWTVDIKITPTYFIYGRGRKDNG